MATTTVTVNVRLRRQWLLRMAMWLIGKVHIETSTTKGRRIGSTPMELTIKPKVG